MRTNVELFVSVKQFTLLCGSEKGNQLKPNWIHGLSISVSNQAKMFPERLLSSFGLINICSLPIHSCEKKRNQFLGLQMQKLLSEAMHLIFFRVSTHLSFTKNTIDFSGTFNEVILYTNVSFKKAILVSCMRAFSIK